MPKPKTIKLPKHFARTDYYGVKNGIKYALKILHKENRSIIRLEIPCFKLFDLVEKPILLIGEIKRESIEKFFGFSLVGKLPSIQDTKHTKADIIEFGQKYFTYEFEGKTYDWVYRLNP